MTTTTLAPADLADALKRAWRDGSPPDVARALRDHPELLRHRTLVVDLAYEEYCLREEAGWTPATESFCRELPAFRSDVREVIRGHRALMDHPELLERADTRWPRPGEVFEGFRVLRELGRGAFARAYLAVDPDTGDRPVVLKLSPGASDEARTLGPVRHPHVADVLWARRVGGLSAICMRYVGAATLRDVIAAAFETATEPPTARTLVAAIEATATGLPPAEAVPQLVTGRRCYSDAIAAIGARIAGALAALHARGVNHGDLKPSNIVLGPGGHPYLIDFNLASGDGSSLHRYGGTLPYMAPERVRRVLGEPAPAAGDRTDVYSFGAVLYEALTGQVPYPPIEPADPQAIAADLLNRQIAGPPPPVRVPGRLARLIGECLSVDPAGRPTAAQLQRRLNRFIVRRRRRAWLMAIAASVIVITGSAIAWGAGRVGEAPTPETDVAAAAPARNWAIDQPVTADDFIARGFWRLDRDPNGTSIDFAEAFRLRNDGRTIALMGYARTRSNGSSDAVRLYSEAIDKRGYRPAWVLNNRAYEAIRSGPNDKEHLLRAKADAQAALQVDPDLTAAKFNWANATYLSRLDRRRWCLDDKQILDVIERDLGEVADRHPNALTVHTLLAEVLAAPTWADKARLDRAVDHLQIAISLGRPAKLAGNGPVLQRAFGPAVLATRLSTPPLPLRVPEPGDPGVAHPPAP